MKRFLKLLFAFSPSLSIAQNNNIFYGGAGDGWNKASYTQSSVAAAFNGGSGDGWNKANYTQSSITTVFNGGSGDGWNKGSYTQSSITTAFYGGNGDGWGRLAYTQQGSTPQFAGGSGDGWNRNGYSQAYTDVAYRGGAGDGWSSTYIPVAPLPIRFLEFQAFKKAQSAQLTWLLADDEEVASFDVERSSNAVNFEQIGTVAQSNAANKRYEFSDVQPLMGNNYYRLRVIGKDGKQEYTSTRVVNFERNTSVALHIYPNPATDIVNVDVPADFSAAQRLVVNVYGMNGVMAYHQKIAGNGMPVIKIPIETLAAGNYVIHIAGDNNKTANGKITIMKP